MKSRFKSNNFVAIFIALILFAIGFVLYFVHEQSQTDAGRSNTQIGTTSAVNSLSASSPEIGSKLRI